MVEIHNDQNVLQDAHIKRLTNLRKNIAKYDENVNKCNIYETNVLAETIGLDMDYLTYSDDLTTEEQNKEINNMEKQFSAHMDRLKQCICVKKMAK